MVIAVVAVWHCVTGEPVTRSVVLHLTVIRDLGLAVVGFVVGWLGRLIGTLGCSVITIE